MVQPSSLLLSLHRHCCTSYGAPLHFTQRPIFSLKSLTLMAQEPSHLSQQEKEQQQQEEEEAAASTSSSNNNNNKNESKSWLQLGVGPSSTVSSQQEEAERRKITELQLFTNPVPAAEHQTPGETTHIVPPVQMPRPFPFFPSSTSFSGEPGPSSSTQADRVVILPPRPQTGVWFVLRASQNQRREPWLPQIARSFLRIRDPSMTVNMVMKYLVNKLGLEHESQVEMTCRGQRLHPTMTLRYVRDIIWCSGEAGQSVPSPSSSTDHLMTLEYSRSIP
ncbi:hypothetical protein LUZ60_007899 [Juncus effusus]|nr:hypothetical protein LUZ60_007899 [Juncus effusus]